MRIMKLILNIWVNIESKYELTENKNLNKLWIQIWVNRESRYE